MAKALIPGAKFRSPTALQGQSDIRDELIYSSIVIAHGGGSTQKAFTVPQGQAIPQMKGAAITPTEAHHLTHTELSTCLEKAGELGAGIGDAAVRSIGLNLETAYPLNAGYSAYGASPREVAEFVNKTYFQFKIGGKTMTQGPAGMFPSSGGLQGSVSTTQNVATLGFAQNGNPLSGGRKLRIPIQIARTDVVVGLFGLANGATYSFTVQAGVGQETMVTCVLGALVRGDVR
ncbi:MAG: hypothetical protein WC729_29335 [Sphingomonas sp.]|jgi:hypothetical protein|uniref:hypothetical protein n=1 Tax=Sphingomonas sp. TaxID=28214 RepID=UPI00356B059D